MTDRMVIVIEGMKLVRTIAVSRIITLPDLSLDFSILDDIFIFIIIAKQAVKTTMKTRDVRQM